MNYFQLDLYGIVVITGWFSCRPPPQKFNGGSEPGGHWPPVRFLTARDLLGQIPEQVDRARHVVTNLSFQGHRNRLFDFKHFALFQKAVFRLCGELEVQEVIIVFQVIQLCITK